MKKKISILISTLVFPLLLRAQSTNLLDNKNGFKSYKIGTLKSDFESKGLILEQVKSDIVNMFYVKNNKENKLFDYDVKLIHLKFNKNNKLSVIMVTLEQGVKLGAVGKYFTEIFGEKEFGGATDQQIPYEGWKGNNIGLYVYYHPPVNNYPDWQPLVYIYNINDEKTFLNDGF